MGLGPTSSCIGVTRYIVRALIHHIWHTGRFGEFGGLSVNFLLNLNGLVKQ